MIKRKKFSSLGLLLNEMNISTSLLAKHLHVDDSLVSKWKSGNRKLNLHYLDEIKQFLMQNKVILRGALREFYPLENIDDNLEELLSSFLCEEKRCTSVLNPLYTSQVALYDGAIGRRQAMSELLDIAEAMKDPCDISYIDAEQYRWLIEDKDYAEQWTRRMYNLLERGFKARFVVHFSAARDSLLQFFEMSGELFFHRNIEWYKHEYYDNDTHWFSFFILGKSISMMGMTPVHSYTAVFRDIFSIMHHKAVIDSVINDSELLFENHDTASALQKMKTLGRNEIYFYLPIPALISASPRIVEKILSENAIESEELLKHIETCRLFREVLYEGNTVISIYQYEMMERCAQEPFISCSLALLTGREISVSADNVAECFLDLAEGLKNDSQSAALTTQQDFAQLSEMNCWCAKNRWLLQMDAQGYRFCDELELVSAAAVVLEKAHRRIPAQRKDKDTVIQFLTDLAEKIKEG